MSESKWNRTGDRKRTYVCRVILFVAVLFAVYTVAKLLISSVHILSFSHQYTSFNEVRDYVSFRLTNFIMEGKNPYTLDMLSEFTVPFMDLYTPFTPLLVAALCKLTGIGVLSGNYVINILFVLLTCLNLWQIIKNLVSSHKKSVFLCVLIYVATFFTMFLTSAPVFNFHADAVGIFMTSVIYLVVYKRKENTLLLAILTVSLVFTKQILMVLALPLFIYYLLKNKKLAWRYFAQCCICGIIVVIVMQIFFPLYWTETIYAQFFAVSSESSLFYAIYNIAHAYYRYWPLLLLLFCGIIGAFVIRRKKGGREKLKISAFVYTLMEQDYAVYLTLNIMIGTIFLLYFSQNFVDGYKYCQDMIAPNLLLLSIYVWNKFFGDSYVKGKNQAIKQALIVLGLCISAAISYRNFSYEEFSEEDARCYTELYEIIQQYEDECIYLGMNSTQYLLQNDLWEPENIYYNDGHMEFFARDFTDNPFINRFFYHEEITKAAQNYVSKVNQMIINKEFALVTVCGDLVVDGQILQQYYYPVGTYPIRNETNGVFDVVVWLPIEEGRE